jgi:eukaryotic-like serine/threonine-protein kinase
MNPADDPRLLAVLEEYISEIEAGRRPDRRELLARHPEIAGELSACLQGLSFVNSAVVELAATAADDGGAGNAFAGDADSPLAQPLGDFQLIRQIGRGGMGVVYEATQLSLNRRVAVKILPFTAALDEKHLRRFKNEAQAAAQLHHTHIVPVYSIGCERSVHYYAMQLIDGQSMADVIRDLRRDKEPAAAGLTSLRASNRPEYFRRITRWGVQAAEALDYAHRLGVVHRDIKPANLLIDRRGGLWITDFGLAQFYGQSGLTQSGDMLGTLRYMSPEQASGRAAVLDQRTDVYSLGVTLYELLSLEPAISGESREEVLARIDAGEVRPLRAVDRSAPVELQTILAKAMAREPGERYSSARAMADDLQRYLADEPILARPPSGWDKAVKWTRRHKSLALGAIVMLFLAAQGLLISTLVIARQQAMTRAALALAQQEAAEANTNFEQARDAVNFFTEVAAEELPKDPRLVEAREHLLQAALDYYQRFIDAHRDNAPVDAALIAARSHIRDILADMSAMDDEVGVMFEMRLLQMPDVQQELELSQDQLDRIQAPGAGPLPPATLPAGTAAMRSELIAQTNQTETVIGATLSPPQLERLKQISRQLRGIWAFSDADVQAALQLSQEQKAAIRRQRAETDSAPTGQGPGEQAVLAALTPRQQSAWKRLIGKPFVTTGQAFDGLPAPGR